MTWLQEILPQIGYGFICSFWQMALLFGLYKLTAAVYLPSPADRFRFAFLLSLLGSSWFLYTVFLGKPSAEWQVAASVTQNLPGSFSIYFNQFMYWLGCVYLGLLAFASLKGHFQWKATSKMMNTGFRKAPVEWRLFTEKYAGLLGIKTKVILKISGTFSPATFGFLKPVILLPASCLTGLSTEQLQAILLHELAHIRRGDYLAAWVLQIAGILLYFNPFMRQLIREAKKECEHACDDLVMQFEYNPLQYAQALLSVAKRGQNMAWALQAQGSHQNFLLNRITRLLGQHDHKKSITWKNIGFPVLAIVLFFGTTWVRNDPDQLSEVKPIQGFKTNTATLQELPKPWKQRVLAARVAILAAAANKSAVIEKAKQETETKVALMEQLLAERRETTESNTALFTPASLVLSANWADEQQAETGIQEMEMAWKQFTALLEKLELMGDLDEKEWEQVAGLITLHNEIRETIYKETAQSQNQASFAAGIAASEPTGKILVIVHEEATGKLAASFMNPEEINAAYTDEFLPENRQQVILLRKKAPAGKKIISL